jgi:hypothetical protein
MTGWVPGRPSPGPADFFRVQRPPVFGWSAVETRVALTSAAAVWVIALAAYQAGRPDLIRSPRLVLAPVWEGME